MSFYTFAETSLTTTADRKRRPGVDKGQIARTIALCIIVFVAYVVRTHHS